MIKFILTTFIFGAGIIHAQEYKKIFPGSEDIELYRIAPTTLHYRFSVLSNGKERDFGAYTDSVFFDKNDKSKLIRIVSF